MLASTWRDAGYTQTVPAVQAVRESARKTECQNRLRQIGLALANYHSAFQHLPAGCIQSKSNIDNGRDAPRATWSIAILPMLEMGDLFAQYDAVHLSTAAVNRTFCATEVPSYRCPSDVSMVVPFEPIVDALYSRSNYAANFGSGSWGKSFWDDTKYRGVMGQNSLLSFSQISDGTAHTVAVAEVQSVADFSDNRGVWAFAAPGASLVGLDCDETCRGINDDPASDWIPYCAGVPGVLPCSFQNNKHSNAGPRSRHVGGAMLLFCDGSTRLVSDQIDIDVLVSQFTSMHGESLDQP